MSNKYDYLPSENRPLSAWAYWGYQILFSIPLIGFIALIVCAISGSNINRRSFARSYFCGLIVVVVLVVILFATGAADGILSMIEELFEELS